jgi:geranylgeranyl pyrophosphate synthase
VSVADDPQERIREQIEYIWKQSGAGLDFIQAMRQILPGQAQLTDAGQDSVRWIKLPYLCCQAAGGDPQWADSIAAAWYLLFIAAHLMDQVEDRDKPDPSWAALAPGAGLNAATGLFFTASLALKDLYQHDETRSVASDVMTDFYAGFLRMSSGQHADLNQPEPTLEQYWEIARDKSGAFFQVACRCGARLASASADQLEGFGLYGQHLGLLKQILDDLEDIQPPDSHKPMHPWPDIARSLPVVYAMSVFPQEERERLRLSLQNVAQSQSAARDAFLLLEQSGAALYLQMEIERHRDLAIGAVRRAVTRADAAQPLISLVRQLGPP